MKCFNCLLFQGFCYIFSLQSGVVIIATIFFTICFMTVVMNTYLLILIDTLDISRLPAILLLYGHVIVILTAIAIGYWGSYTEKSTLIMTAGALLFLAILIYLVASVLSYFPSTYHLACIYNRCPDHVWIEDSFWRQYYFIGEKAVEVKVEELGPEEETLTGWEKLAAAPARVLLNTHKERSIENLLPIWIKVDEFKDQFSKQRKTEVSSEETEKDEEKEKEEKDEEEDPLEKEKKKVEKWIGFGRGGDGGSENEMEKTTKAEMCGSGGQMEKGHLEPGYIFSKQKIRHPLIGLIFSILFNITYLVFLLISLGTYISYANEAAVLEDSSG